MTKLGAISRIEELADVALRRNAPLAELTSFGIGGEATAIATVSGADALGRTIAIARDAGLEVLVVGGGTNLLACDDGFEGLVIRPISPRISISNDGRRVTVGASVEASRLVAHLVERGLAGLEFASGLPGTIGGAIAGNAGCFGCTFAERLVEALVVGPAGEVIRVEDPRAFDFGYRRSAVASHGWIVVEATLAIEPGDQRALRAAAAGHLETRRLKHPSPGTRTAGSFFKNLLPEREGERRRAAGELLDSVGAKEMSVGDAAVFERHANIIVNRGRATARDVLELADRMACAVLARFGVVLEPEVRFVGTLRPRSRS